MIVLNSFPSPCFIRKCNALSLYYTLCRTHCYIRHCNFSFMLRTLQTHYYIQHCKAFCLHYALYCYIVTSSTQTLYVSTLYRHTATSSNLMLLFCIIYFTDTLLHSAMQQFVFSYTLRRPNYYILHCKAFCLFYTFNLHSFTSSTISLLVTIIIVTLSLDIIHTLLSHCCILHCNAFCPCCRFLHTLL